MKKIILIVLCFGLVGCVTTVDESLPYAELPEIKLATAATLVASPSHPASYLSTEELPAGTTLRVLGRDENAAWLLVSHENILGWIPSFFSGTNVATLETAIIVEPLSAQCTKYLGTTSAINEPWQSTIDGAVVVVGTILRTDTNADFSAASLTIKTDGRGTPIDSDYLHTPLTASSSIVFFAYSLITLQEGDSIGFAVSDGGEEEPAFQAAFFSNSCAPDHVKLPIGKVKQRAEQAAPVQVAATTQPVVVQKADGVITHGTYIWTVRAANIDDVAAILVNGEIVAGGSYGDGLARTDWVDITTHVIPNQDTQITLISLNGYSIGTWSFLIRRGETIIWGQEGEDPTENTMQYAKTVIISPNGEVAEVEPMPLPNSTLVGEWLVHIQDMDDFGIVLVNGQPIGGAVLCPDCPPTIIDISPWLDANHGNTVSMTSWNVLDSPFSYRFSLEKDGTTIWQQDKSGEASAGLAFSEAITITTEGELQIASSSQKTASADGQESVSPIVTNNECNVFPAERCIPAETGFDGWNVGVIKQFMRGDSWAAFSVGDPSILFYEDKFHLWFVGRSSNDGNFAIGYATSVDGVDWEVEPAPVLIAGEADSWESRGVAAPSVILKDGQFEMFYLGFHDSWQGSIGAATSVDGINWKRNPNNPVLSGNPTKPWMGYTVRDPSVLYNGQAYQMWFAASGEPAFEGSWQLGYAESTDGSYWTISTNEPVIALGSDSSWKAHGVIAPEILFIKDTYHMWYTGRADPYGNDWRIGHATSRDAITWNEDLNNPVFVLGSADEFASGRVAHPTVAISAEGYHLWYAGSQAENQETSQIGLATSKDGVRWLR